MIRLENVDIFGWDSAIRGMRNPMNSWDKSDSKWGCDDSGGTLCTGDCGEWCTGWNYIIGKNDLSLMKKLAKAGNDHGKFGRMINVTLDITAPLYWWKEFDTYKVGTVANSCSTMHKIHAKEFTLDDFSCEHLFNRPLMETAPGEVGLFNVQAKGTLECSIVVLNAARANYLWIKENSVAKVIKAIGFEMWDSLPGETDAEKKENLAKQYWWQMIQLLPSSYNQRRTVQLNYQVLWSMYQRRKDHKLDEWREFCKWVETLPYFKEIYGIDLGE